MAAGTVAISDVIVPEIFTPYMMTQTEEKSRLIRSGAIARDAEIDSLLAGAGLTFNTPSYKDLDNDEENVSSDTGSDSTPNKIGTVQEISVRLNRNNSWSSADLVSALIGNDPMNAIASRVSDYWTRRLQAASIATIKGVYADNAASPSGTDTHTLNDMTHDVSGSSFVDGLTNMTAEAFIDATATMGDSMEDLALVVCHSIVYARLLKNNLIDFVSDSANGNAVRIPTYLGREVIVDDAMPATGGVYETWLFGRGAIRLGLGAPKVPTEVFRDPAANNGAGKETLHSRIELCIHPNGHAYKGTSPNGGPSNAATTNNLAHAASWSRVFAERKMIKMARLITREHN